MRAGMVEQQRDEIPATRLAAIDDDDLGRAGKRQLDGDRPRRAARAEIESAGFKFEGELPLLFVPLFAS